MDCCFGYWLENTISEYVEYLTLTENKPVEQESPAKKKRSVTYKVDDEVAQFIEGDTANKNVWEEALGFTKEGAQVSVTG